MTLEICCPSTGNHEAAVLSWIETMSQPWPIKIDAAIRGEAAGYLHKVQKAWQNSQADIIAYFHSDLYIYEKDWDKRVLAEFESDPNVILVSFFGARNLGRDEIYTVPYHPHHLARGDCWSNMRDAEVHGRRLTGEMDVAMIDSFSLIIRNSFLDSFDAFPAEFPPSHGWDMYLCMMAARMRKRVRLVGIDCSHSSGGVRGDGRFDYGAWAARTKWGSDQAMHAWVHDFLYNEFQDVLPIKR